MENRFLGLIEHSLKEHWELPALTDYNGTTLYYKDLAKKIAEYHIILEYAGIKKGEKVAILGRNCSNWVIAFFGTLSYGAVAVPILHEFKPDNVHHIVNHSEAKILIAASSNWENLNEEMMPELRLIMLLDDFSIQYSKDKEMFQIREHIGDYFEKKYPEPFSRSDIHFHIEEPEEMAVLNYTSGTTSFSKGVMIPYRSLWSNTQFAYDNLPFIHPEDNIVCMLPMAHMYGLAFEILNGINKGCHIHFLTRTPSPKIISEAFAKVKPALILAVPLLIEKIIKNKVFPELEKPVMKALLKVPYINKKIYKTIADKLYASFGGKLGELVIGGAAINKVVLSMGTNYAKTVYIISDKEDEIGKYIMEELERGATVIDAEGCYTEEPRPMLMTVVPNQDIARLVRAIHAIDPGAFLIIQETVHVLGEGYTPIRKLAGDSDVTQR